MLHRTITESQAGLPAMRLLYLTKGARQFAYGLASVALPVYLAADRLSPIWLGAFLAVSLLSGAVQMSLAGRVTRRISVKAVAVSAAVMMGLGGLLTASHVLWLIGLAALLGTLNAAAQEIGPFLPIEQVTLASGDRGVHRMAVYNALGTGCLALGTLAGGILSFQSAFLLYALCGSVMAIIYAITTFQHSEVQTRVSTMRRFGTAEKLAALFAVDAFAGGLIVQGFLAFWLVSRYHVPPQSVGLVLAIGNVLSALSLFVAAWLGKRFGLLNTMVFTHLPSNVLLAVVPFAPSFTIATALLLLRYSLSQMDVPTRQAFVVAVVPEDERIYASGITSAVRPLAAATSPLLATLAMQSAAFGAPFFVAGGLKCCYDIAVYISFRKINKSLPLV